MGTMLIFLDFWRFTLDHLRNTLGTKWVLGVAAPSWGLRRHQHRTAQTWKLFVRNCGKQMKAVHHPILGAGSLSKIMTATENDSSNYSENKN